MAQQALRAERVAAMREGDDDAQAGADEPGQLVLGLREAAGGERRAQRLEGERLSPRERIELGRALQRHRLQRLLLPDAPDLLRLPDEVRGPRERRP
jgi:hypothetical protein